MGLVGLRVSHCVSVDEVGLYERGIPSFQKYIKGQLARSLANVLIDNYAKHTERAVVEDPSGAVEPTTVEVKIEP